MSKKVDMSVYLGVCVSGPNISILHFGIDMEESERLTKERANLLGESNYKCFSVMRNEFRQEFLDWMAELGHTYLEGIDAFKIVTSTITQIMDGTIDDDKIKLLPDVGV
jgi:hypothetical protein